MSRLRSVVETAVMRSVPSQVYFKLTDIVGSWLKPERAGGLSRSVLRDGETYRIVYADGTEFHFIDPGRYRRYAWPNGLEHIRSVMAEKYQNEHVRMRPGDVVIEAGANVGEFTELAALTCRFVHAFEPDPNVLPALRKNTARYGNIRIHTAALGDRSGSEEFYVSTEGANSSIVPPTVFTDVQTVEVRTVATVMKAERLERLGFLKVEAEGFEPEILRGCGDRLADIERIAVDCSPERGGRSPADDCEMMLREAGFETWRRGRSEVIPEMLFALNRRHA